MPTRAGLLHNRPLASQLARLTSTTLRGITIWVRGGPVDFVVRDGVVRPIPLGRRQ